MKDWFIDGFEYDAWANLIWAEAMQAADSNILNQEALALLRHSGVWPDFTNVGPQQRAREVFTHILWAERIWIGRLGIQVEPPEDTLANWIQALPKAWVAVMTTRSPDDVIDYKNQSGHPFTSTLGEIASHVITHGIYHRGQLREIVGTFAPDQVISTDMLGFFLDRKGE